MVKVSNLSLPLDHTEDDLKRLAAKELKVSAKQILSLDILKKSVDARKKQAVHFVYTVAVSLADERAFPSYELPKAPAVRLAKRCCRPVVIGAGPAGLFAALTLAEAGLNPTLVERGADVESRTRAVERFWKDGILSPLTNVQFGEGGAGTFSDGKLNTGTKDIRQRKILETFVACGAPHEILYLAKPHIGTDVLRKVIQSLRERIISLGGTVKFGHRVCDFIWENGALCEVVCETESGMVSIPADCAVLAIGHSARDTFSLLVERNVVLSQKPFSVGVRIEHLQRMVDAAQYGSFAGHPALPAADYKLSAHLPNGRSVYTFCMCPGGEVVAAASEEGGVCTNGMSLHARAEKNANSAVLVNVTPSDFESDHPLSGVTLQRTLEQAAYRLGGETYRAPAQCFADFATGRKTCSFGAVSPTYRPGVTGANLREILPEFVGESLIQGIRLFDRKLAGFAAPDAVLTGVEARSSSPVRIERNELLLSSRPGIYPCGEGAGYAGGILSAAVDGIRVAEAILEQKA
ncbi:MAG: FAD-binding protein [Oscillospiraceae bacterium]|nr:FAD-binding protein [Oscillospiraceae bacterium]